MENRTAEELEYSLEYWKVNLGLPYDIKHKFSQELSTVNLAGVALVGNYNRATSFIIPEVEIHVNE